MPVEIGVWRIDSGIQAMNLQGLNLETRLQSILDDDIAIASPAWMVIGREVLTDHGGRIDILAMDRDGSLVAMELKRDQTPRDIVAQILDYGSWIRTLAPERIAETFQSYVALHHPERAELSLDEAFRERFGEDLPEDLNRQHELVIVATTLDASTERIVAYLSEEYRVRINALFFRVFRDGDHEYLTRAWLTEPAGLAARTGPRPSGDQWNGECYVSFGEGDHRKWSDALRYGFVSAGGGDWYVRTLATLEPGARIWVNVPRYGYVGVGTVKAASVRFDEFLVTRADGSKVPITEMPVDAPDMLDESHGEYLVAVEWINTVPRLDLAIKERGFFGNQNTVARPLDPRWDFTIERLKVHFEVA